MKQLVLGALMYAEDYDERWSLYRTFVSGSDMWPHGLRPYIKNEQIYVCPSRPEQGGFQDGGWAYGMNYHHLREWLLADVEHPAQHFAFVENHNQLAACPLGGFGDNYTPNLDPLPHNDGVNVTFVDGHPKWMKPDGPVMTAMPALGSVPGITGLMVIPTIVFRSAPLPVNYGVEELCFAPSALIIVTGAYCTGVPLRSTPGCVSGTPSGFNTGIQW